MYAPLRATVGKELGIDVEAMTTGNTPVIKLDAARVFKSKTERK